MGKAKKKEFSKAACIRRKNKRGRSHKPDFNFWKFWNQKRNRKRLYTKVTDAADKAWGASQPNMKNTARRI